MLGKRSMRKAAGLWVMSSRTWSAPLFFISVSMARATMSRGARDLSGMKFVHERGALDVFQNAALAAHGFADEEGFGLG